MKRLGVLFVKRTSCRRGKPQTRRQTWVLGNVPTGGNTGDTLIGKH